MNKKKRKTFFKDHAEYRNDLQSFLNKYGAIYSTKSDQTHALFEFSMLDSIIKYFEKNKFKINPLGLKSKSGSKKKDFIFALSPKTKPENASYFILEKSIGNDTINYEIRHNLNVRSATKQEIFFSPDYTICRANSIISSKFNWYYNGKHDRYFVEAKNLISFAEAKNYMPSPELVINFVGLVNEFLPELISGEIKNKKYCFGPTLFIAGTGNGHLQNIKKSFADRYHINILFNMIVFGTQLHSDNSSDKIKEI